MLPLPQKILFLVFAAVMAAAGFHGFHRLYRRIAAGRRDTEPRTNQPLRRLWYSVSTALTQRRTFRRRPCVSFFHSLIFYGFVLYLLVNLIDALEGFVELPFPSHGLVGNLYILAADLLSAGVLFGVVALVLRRFLLPSRRDFRFNQRTLLHKDIRAKYIARDSIVVSAFILFHVGSRAIGAGARLAAEGPGRFAPFATLLSHLFAPQHAFAWRIFGYWGALGSVLAFLVYFPRSKHIHIFLAPAKYFVAQSSASGVLPPLDVAMEVEEPKLGAKKLEDLAWPRLLDAYACIQCNRCQDVCPATATGKSLSPSALEINKRMELNDLSSTHDFENGQPSPNALLSFALSPEALWACTTCGACIEVCPVQDEPMLDIIDIRRHQVMIEGEFPAQLQSAFRGMERAKNPWGISHDKRMDWAAGLNVRTIEQNPSPDVLFWVGCAPSYDPQSQKSARALVQLLDIAEVDYAVLGKQECCTGDSARRAGNEYLYRQLADANVTTLNQVKPKLVVTTCPHCMNALGKEYKQIGGDFKVIHHTEYLESLVNDGRLSVTAGPSTVAYHDPCYLGRHNGVYDAPRNLLKILSSNSVIELPRNRENSFCCGAGGAQFWKEEEEGNERISENRYREAEAQLKGADDKVLAVGCPFCKSMLQSTPAKGPENLAVRDVAELLLEGVQRGPSRERTPSIFPATVPPVASGPAFYTAQSSPHAADAAPISKNVDTSSLPPESIPTRSDQTTLDISSGQEATAVIPLLRVGRKAWNPKPAITSETHAADPTASDIGSLAKETAAQDSPSRPLPELRSGESAVEPTPGAQPPDKRKAWAPKRKTDD